MKRTSRKTILKKCEESESDELSMAGKMNFGLFGPEKQS